jgi:hypothetical protein
MALLLTPAQSIRLFTAIRVQQSELLHATHRLGNDVRPTISLPPCLDCGRRSPSIVLSAEGDLLTFTDCGHRFTLTRPALVAGLNAMR